MYKFVNMAMNIQAKRSLNLVKVLDTKLFCSVLSRNINFKEIVVLQEKKRLVIDWQFN